MKHDNILKVYESILQKLCTLGYNPHFIVILILSNITKNSHQENFFVINKTVPVFLFSMLIFTENTFDIKILRIQKKIYC